MINMFIDLYMLRVHKVTEINFEAPYDGFSQLSEKASHSMDKKVTIIKAETYPTFRVTQNLTVNL